MFKKLKTKLPSSFIFALTLHALVFAALFSWGSTQAMSADLSSQKNSVQFSVVTIKQENSSDLVSSRGQEIIKDNEAGDYLAQLSTSKKSTQNKIPTTSAFTLKGQRIMPQYPQRSLKLGQQGVIYLRILVSKTGEQEKIEFKQKSTHSLLNIAALDAVKKWEFNPITIGGHAVRSWVEVPIEFKLG